MVKVAYEGRKNMTRRIEGLKVLNEHPDEWTFTGWIEQGLAQFERKNNEVIQIKPRYRVGDECWIKERWASGRKYDNRPPRLIPVDREIWFPDEVRWNFDSRKGKARSSRFMCKWMARCWLRITKVNDPHQIQTIREEDCIAEGIVPNERESYTDGFHNLWNRLHPKPGERWEDNPWVFCYEFEMIEGKPQ